MKILKQGLLLIVFIVLSLNGFSQEKFAYYCPPCNSDCDNVAYTTPGNCPHCGMALVKESIKTHQKAASAKRLTVLFYLQDGVEVLDFAGPLEVFSYASFNVAIVSKTKDKIVSQGVLKISPDYSIADAPKADILAFFGGNANNAANDPEVIEWVKKQQPDYYFSVCTGAFVIGKAGLLDNLTATTFHESIDGLRKALPKTKVLSNVRFVDNGKVMTTAGISAGIDGALHLVARIRGEAEAKRIATYMEYDKWVPGEGLIIHASN
jgi:transcriptional regulator GlxA family with amidase domain